MNSRWLPPIMGAMLGVIWQVARADDPPPASFSRDVAPFLEKHCYHCHAGDNREGDVALDRYGESASTTGDDSAARDSAAHEAVQRDRRVWEKVLALVRGGEMPPEERPRPDAAEAERALTAIESVLAEFDCDAPRPAGRVTLRRLNRAEYDNTVRDLTGLDFKPAADFPTDDVGYGFDNIGDVLSLSPLLLEKYLLAAEIVLSQAIADVGAPPPPRKTRLDLRASRRAGGMRQEWGHYLHSEGAIFANNGFLEPGVYHVRIEATGQQVGSEVVRGAFKLDDTEVAPFDVATEPFATATIEFDTRLKSGSSRIAIVFLNPYRLPDEKDDQPTESNTGEQKTADQKPADPKPADPKPADPKPADLKPADQAKQAEQKTPGFQGFGRVPPREPDERDRLLIVRRVDVDGPYDPPPPVVPESHRRIMAHQEGLAPRAAAREIVTRFATRAFRRPAKPGEVEGCLSLYDLAEKEGERFEDCMRLALARVLVSPHFLFRVELDPPDAEPGKSYPINEFELASRLSYFFWSSMPDEELFDLAAAGRLRAELGSQMARMLNDERSAAFMRNFAGQWLTLRKLAAVSPDSQTFPEFDTDLRAAMVRETELFFEAVVREDRSIFDLLDADFSFVNERLAKHYGMEGVSGSEFQRVTLPANRGGVLTQASILTLTSNPTRTSPVKRGKWVLEQLLNTPPPPPPPDVPQLDEGKQLTGSLRQRLEQHRANALCASCHQRMDPLGFAFENYDAIGRWREKEGEFAIDASGVLPGGETFQGPAELKSILKQQRDLFRRCLTEKILTYALGRGLEHYDDCAVDKIVAALEKNGDKFSTLLVETVNSEPFQKRTATGTEEGLPRPSE